MTALMLRNDVVESAKTKCKQLHSYMRVMNKFFPCSHNKNSTP